jgi:hypothetical protein
MALGSNEDKKAALDDGAWMFNVVTSVDIIMVNNSLMAAPGFSFGKNRVSHLAISFYRISGRTQVHLHDSVRTPGVHKCIFLFVRIVPSVRNHLK